jgi:hypothetical protein
MRLVDKPAHKIYRVIEVITIRPAIAGLAFIILPGRGLCLRIRGGRASSLNADSWNIIAIGICNGAPHFFSERLAALYQLRFSSKISHRLLGCLGGCAAQALPKPIVAISNNSRTIFFPQYLWITLGIDRVYMLLICVL